VLALNEMFLILSCECSKHTIEDHVNCCEADGWQKRWLVVYKSEVRPTI
jgi:hypothetical protein